MSSYVPPVTQPPIYSPESFIPREIPDTTASVDVISLTNQANESYNTAKTINLALSQSSVVNVIYDTITPCSLLTQYSPYSLYLASGSYSVSGNVLVDMTNNPNWTSIYLFGVINGVGLAQQGIQYDNNSSQKGGMLQVYVPFSFYFAPIGGSTANIAFVLAISAVGGTGTYTIGPAIGADISVCRIIGPNPYLPY